MNDKSVDILPGMTVKHALINAGVLKEVETGAKVRDEWGNEVGLGGSMSENMKIYVSKSVHRAS